MVRAKFKVASVQDNHNGAVSVKMNPVYSQDPTHENKAFWDATPCGEITLLINGQQDPDSKEYSRRPAAESFIAGLGKDTEFYVDFTPVPAAG